MDEVKTNAERLAAIQAAVSALSILGMRASGMKQADIAAEFGVSVSLIGSIESGKIWSHVTGVVRNA